MVKAKKYVLVKSFYGAPKESDFAVVEEELPDLQDGEFLAKAAYFSVDPYQRNTKYSNFPCDVIGSQIAVVIESKNPDYATGDWVMGHFGWRTYTVVNLSNETRCPQKPYCYRLPDFGDLPRSLGLGVCGRVGNSAYFGFLNICRPQPGETVVVSGAAGAVGSHVGQIAKIKGCRVLGLAGTNEKCKYLTDELGYDFAINYKTGDVATFLKECASNGVDCYFDNVGGELSSTVIRNMNEFGRVAVCGAISAYNEIEPQKIQGTSAAVAKGEILREISPSNSTLLQRPRNKQLQVEYQFEGRAAATMLQPYIVSKQLRIEGFLVNSFAPDTMEGIQQNLQWIKEGKLKYKEHINKGFDSAVKAFIGLFYGANTGKTLVEL